MAVDVRELLPDGVRDNVRSVFGERGREWIEGLPAVVQGLGERWQLRLTSRSYGGGTHSLVLAVTCADGTPAVLKVPVQDDENRVEAAALRRYAGEGAALLYEEDPASGALLLERLEPGTPLTGDGRAGEIATELLRRLRRPAPAGHPFPLVRDLVRGWTERLPACPLLAPMAGEVRAALEALRVPGGPEVLVNRDAHLGNILAAEREPWLLIDPKALVGEPAFDGGWLLLDMLSHDPAPAAARRLAAEVGAGLGVDPDRVRAWALLRAAENVPWYADLGQDPAESLALVRALAG